jgi:hypothetical protein
LSRRREERSKVLGKTSPSNQEVLESSQSMLSSFQPSQPRDIIDSPFQKILKKKPSYRTLVHMLEDDSKEGEDVVYDALKCLMKARLLEIYPEEAKEAR